MDAVPQYSPTSELTMSQAADFLQVSESFVTQLLDQEKVPFRKVGTHRHILFKDLTVYKNAVDTQRTEVLDELSRQAQGLKLGY
jgi:excisionase family DNA binding protein